MSTFIDPRLRPDPGKAKPIARTTIQLDALTVLHRLCREGRLYEVERWIQEGRPLQTTERMLGGRKRIRSALNIAVDDGNNALTLLLLCNGYDPNLEHGSPLNVALRSRRRDLLDLLLEWGADPHRVDLEDLFQTYNAGLWERFHTLGVDLTADHALIETLAYHTSNKPLFGFVKRHWRRDPRIQRALDTALGYHVEEGNGKGVHLCLWAGANPHVAAPSLRYPDRGHQEKDGTEQDDNHDVGASAIWRACLRGDAQILKRLGPDPAHDDFDDLYCWARSGDVVALLASYTSPRNMGALIQAHIWTLANDINQWQSTDALGSLFQAGPRWEQGTADEIAGVRRALLKTSDGVFGEILKLLVLHDYCSPEILRELARTPAVRTRMQKVGFIPALQDAPSRLEQYGPTRSREVLKKCGVELPKPRKAPVRLSRSIQIGVPRQNGREIRLDREVLFHRVWTTPVGRLAEDWGISGVTLAKACRRLQIPVPPRGYWAKLKAGAPTRRPKLPTLPPGEAEEIVLWESS